MNQSSLHLDEDQDSLFGSPPPSSARGRSPPRETSVVGEEIRPTIAFPSAGMGRKNVGTIALPGSHMSCAELPANLPASSLSLPRPTSSHNSSSSASRGTAGTPTPVHVPVVMLQSSTRPVPSKASSTASAIRPASASSRKRKTPKSKSSTPASPTPPITLPGPNEPTPPNFLRSQSSLLGLAGLVGSVKPAQLYTHASQPAHVRQPRAHSPTRGSTPAYPIVLDDDQDISRVEKHSRDQLQTPQHLDQLDPEMLRSNIMSSLAEEKNIFPVLESLIKLLGGKPHLPPANHPPQPFARPYGHGIFNVQPSPPVVPLSFSIASTTPLAPPPKRRKLKHVPAGAADWDVPFPFAAGEGPEAYRNTWARDRARQLVTQLLELVRNAAKRAAVRTANGRSPRGQTKAGSSQSSRSTSVETQIGQIDLSQADARGSLLQTCPNKELAALGMQVDGQSHHSCSLEISSTIGSQVLASKDGTSVDLESAMGEGGSAAFCDYSAFEEWLSQLQQLAPLETDPRPLDSDWNTCPSAPLDLATSNQALDIQVPMSHVTPDEAIDPTLLAMSQQFESPTSATSTVVPSDVPQLLDISSTLPVLAHSPRSSLSSLTGPLTPHSEAFADIPTSMIAHQDPARDLAIHHHTEKDRPSFVHAVESSSSPTEASLVPRTTAAQKGKARADDDNVASSTPSTSSRSTPSGISTSKGALDKWAILERARERRKELVAEIERAKIKIWETTIENAVLVHITRDGSP